MTVSNQEPAGLQEGVLLRELNRRVTNGVAFAINLVSAAAIRAEGAEAKRALSDVAELLHGYADLHRALAVPAGETLIHAATYLRKLGCGMRRAVLDRMNIKLAFATQPLALQPPRCWHLGLIVHELVMHAARHACFDDRAGQIRIKLTRIGGLVNCVILDNGSRPARETSDRELRIARDIARALGGRIEQGFGADFTSIVLSFPLTERERGANWSIATRQMRTPRRTRATAPDDAAHVSCRAADALGGLLSPSHHMDAP
ncbi:sensor histidine kinase [Bradyrhizobium yuanmingense]|uniref:sensor histidine kinase n=1 Tax=Bradyrhizobium yuanmingense TaxID=108015 RepID=UPI0023BA2860|nr:sensor histidine kinase [Bradyrhizobium yuanmingense]MDF0515722.1 sensor histidine kinase [Bradyrhizobium yuanmingense]